MVPNEFESVMVELANDWFETISRVYRSADKSGRGMVYQAQVQIGVKDPISAVITRH